MGFTQFLRGLILSSCRARPAGVVCGRRPDREPRRMLQRRIPPGRPGASSAVAPNNDAQVLSHLNLVLRWSRQWGRAPSAYLARSGDELYVENGQAITPKVVELEFQSALAQAELIGESSPKAEPVAGNAGSAINAQNRSDRQQSIRQQTSNVTSELDEVNRKIPTVRPTERAALTSQRDTLQGQLQLAQALARQSESVDFFHELGRRGQRGGDGVD